MPLQLTDVLRRQSLGARHYIEGYPITFGEGFKPIPLNCGMMDKYIFPAILLNEPEPLCIIEPLYRTFYHLLLLLLFYRPSQAYYLPTPTMGKALSLFLIR